MAESIKVEIFNHPYTIGSDGDNEYVHRLAAYVDAKMREVARDTKTVDSYKIAILAALHITDELHRLRGEQEQMDADLAQRSAACTEELDRVFRTRAADAA